MSKNSIDELFELTTDQGKAFDRLKKAVKECQKLNVFFYNNYGTLGAVDRAKIKDYNDIKGDDGILDGVEAYNPNTIRIPADTWADDPHYFHPTK
jgi:hypothetical protein